MRRPFPDHRDPNQPPMHQYPPPEFERRQQEDFQSRVQTPVSGKIKFLLPLMELRSISVDKIIN